MENFKELIQSPEFHFLVGHDRRKLTIHAGLAHNLSAPLDALMNNCCMKEAVTRTAIIDDVEEETFIAFCEFGYKGNYATPCRKDKVDTHLDAENQLKDSNPQRETEPEPEPQDTGPESEASSYGWRTRASERARKKKKSYYCSPPPEIEYAKSIYVESPFERRWSQLRHLKFVGDEATISSHPDLLAHAKIYVFATRYLVDPLRKQCLKSLHRDLCNFPLNGRTMTHILDLLEYTYEQTGRQEPDGCYSLRMLVILYISCEARTLAENTRFRHILDDHGEMASDLVAKLVE